jgi:hypothetical protein
MPCRTRDVTFLFIINKKFAIHFVDDENNPDAPVAGALITGQEALRQRRTPSSTV